MERETKRVFLGMECHAPWPDEFPKGRILAPEDRHVTLAFIGNVEVDPFLEHLKKIPLPPFTLGFAGSFNHCHFFPKKHPHVVAWEVDVKKRRSELLDYQKNIEEWLAEGNYHVDDRDFIPHMTISRGKFSIDKWKKAFTPLPLYLCNIHLYESAGSSRYQPIWTHSLPAPFTEFEHTADIAFEVRGRNIGEIFDHALTALAFQCPEILQFADDAMQPENLDDVVMLLNRIVGMADAEVGTPLKAVSYHGKLKERTDYWDWEMIVDV